MKRAAWVLAVAFAFSFGPLAVPQAEADAAVPAWDIGSSWFYAVNGGNYGTGSMTWEVTSVAPVQYNATTTFAAYAVRLAGSGTYVDATSVRYPWELRGELIIRTSDLAHYRETLDLTLRKEGSTQVYQNHTVTTYSMPSLFDVYGFPIQVGSSWSKTTVESTSGWEKRDRQYNFQWTRNVTLDGRCTATTTRSTSAGTFNVYVVEVKGSAGNATYYYSPDSKNAVAVVSDSPLGQITMELAVPPRPPADQTYVLVLALVAVGSGVGLVLVLLLARRRKLRRKQIADDARRTDFGYHYGSNQLSYWQVGQAPPASAYEPTTRHARKAAQARFQSGPQGMPSGLTYGQQLQYLQTGQLPPGYQESEQYPPQPQPPATQGPTREEQKRREAEAARYPDRYNY